jgi:hypothetical protein
MKRREFITLFGGAACWPLAAHAQQPKMLRVGYSGIMQRDAPHYAAFEKRMAELGYQQGRNFAFEYIQAANIEGYELTYRELAARKVDILLAAGNEPALRAARTAAGTTPIVFIALDFDPVEEGLCGQPIASWRQFHRDLCEPTRVSGKTCRTIARGLSEGAPRWDSLGLRIAGASRGGRGDG